LGQALHSAGYDRPSFAEATAWIGDGVEALVSKGLGAALGRAPDEELFRRTLTAFDRCYGARLFRASSVYPGAAAALDRIAAAGCIVGCITNKRESYACALLDQAGLARHLQFICGGDTFAAKKPHPDALLGVASANGLDPSQCVMIGDSDNDRIAAAAAGFEFIFAAYGYASADDARLTDGLAVASSMSEIAELLCPRQARK
jgi:phosphoglycolate phosphatase